MAFVITQACCSDAMCAAVCPADCIHSTPDDQQGRSFRRSRRKLVDLDHMTALAGNTPVPPPTVRPTNLEENR